MNDFSIIEKQVSEREEQLRRFYDQYKLPDNWNASKALRITKCEQDFFAFAKTYFPEYFPFAFNKWHRELVRDALRTDRPMIFYGGPRGFGKTSIFRIFKIWCACFGKKTLYGKASDTIDLVVKDFREVRWELRYNPRLLSDFGQLIDNVDNAYEFAIKPHTHNKKGTLFIALSCTVSARGYMYKGNRFDFIEIDDFEDFSTSINPDISKYKLDVIERDFYPALGDTGSLLYLGNNSRTTSILNILAQLSEIDRKALHPSVEIKLIDAWDEIHNRPTWHERYKFKTEEEMRQFFGVSINIWNAEFRQKPSPPEGVRFLLKHWLTYEKLPSDAKGIIFCDPAFGQSSDYKTFVVLLYSPSIKKFLVPECFVRRCGWEEYFLALYNTYSRFADRLFYIGWEANFAQAQYLEFRKIYISTRKLPDLPIRKIFVEGNKFFRIEQLETPYSLGNILFAIDFLQTADGKEAHQQLIGYTGKKDENHKVDFPDALASAYKEVWKLATQNESSMNGIQLGGKRRSAERW